MRPAPLRFSSLGPMWMLVLGGIFLAAAEACIFCRLPDHGLSGRLHQLCSQMEAQWKDCEASWNFPAFALGKIRHPGTGPAIVTPVPQGGQHPAGFPAVPQLPPPPSTAFSGRTGHSPWESFLGLWEKVRKGPRSFFWAAERIPRPSHLHR